MQEGIQFYIVHNTWRNAFENLMFFGERLIRFWNKFSFSSFSAHELAYRACGGEEVMNKTKIMIHLIIR